MLHEVSAYNYRTDVPPAASQMAEAARRAAETALRAPIRTPEMFPCLSALVQKEVAFDLMVATLRESFLDCAGSGRMADWEALAHASIKVLGARFPTLHEVLPSPIDGAG